ncbi:MAG: NAD(P)-dependent oxidoreductase [Zoogloeaceae bacterium]|jgi:nucleoside-diphosphate-sugar epimerase|nr:NAD(P)-dependent oxidoreductase [Zoogloeaceae bacterium]
MHSSKSILVTGAAGFLGKEIVRQLNADYRILTTDLTGNMDFPGDLADPGFVETLPEADIIIHSAAVQYVTPTLPFFRRAPWFHRNNVEATRNLTARYSGKAGYFLQVGTSMMYDQTGLATYRIDSPLKGVGVYSRSKLASVRLAQGMNNPVGVMIPCIIGGCGREGLFRRFVETMTRQGFCLLPGSCNHLTHMVHVEDAASLIHCMVQQEARGFFNCAGPEPLSIRQWIEIIKDELHLGTIRDIQIPYSFIRVVACATGYRILAREQQLMLGQSHVLSVDESLALGWNPHHSNERIVRDIARHVAALPNRT